MCVLHRYVQAKLKALENEAKIMKDVRSFLHVMHQNLLQGAMRHVMPSVGLTRSWSWLLSMMR
jgi:hypothetical protein